MVNFSWPPTTTVSSRHHLWLILPHQANVTMVSHGFLPFSLWIRFLAFLHLLDLGLLVLPPLPAS